MSKKYFSYGIAALVVGALAFGYLNGRKLYSGFCFDQNRYLTDEEIQNVAIDFLIKHRSQDAPEGVDFASTSFYTDPELPKYLSIEDFRQRNPDCCRPVVTKDSSKHSYSFWLDERGFEYSVYIYEKIEGRPEPYSTFHKISSCGEHSLSMDTNRPHSSSIRAIQE